MNTSHLKQKHNLKTVWVEHSIIQFAKCSLSTSNIGAKQQHCFLGWMRLVVLQQKWHRDVWFEIMAWPDSQQQHSNVLRGASLNSRQEIRALTLSPAASNCCLMKQLFCGIYNRVFMVMVSLLLFQFSSCFPLCLARSALTCQCFFPKGQVRQYVRGH